MDHLFRVHVREIIKKEHGKLPMLLEAAYQIRGNAATLVGYLIAFLIRWEECGVSFLFEYGLSLKCTIKLTCLLKTH